MEPEEGLSRPARRRRNVVFPAPSGPISPIISPFSISRSILSIAASWLNFFVRLLILKVVILSIDKCNAFVHSSSVEESSLWSEQAGQSRTVNCHCEERSDAAIPTMILRVSELLTDGNFNIHRHSWLKLSLWIFEIGFYHEHKFQPFLFSLDVFRSKLSLIRDEIDFSLKSFIWK